MKKQLLFVFAFFVSLGFSQDPRQKIQSYINSNSSKLNISASELSNWIIESETSSETTGITNYLVLQTHSNIKITNSYIYFWIKNGEVINAPEGFISNIASKVNTTSTSFDVVEGFSKALVKLNEIPFTSALVSSDKNKYKLTNGALTEDLTSAELVYFPNENGDLVLSWSYEFYTQDTKHLWKVKLDATTGDLLEKIDLVHTCSFGPKHNHFTCQNATKEFNSNQLFKESAPTTMLTPGTTNYRVIPFNYESPNHIARQLVVNPEAATALAPLTVAASPNGWHNTSTTVGGSTATALYAYTRGNNVFAYSDYTNTNPTNPTTYANASSGTYPSLTFDHPYGGTGVTASSYINAAITNLFYQNNVMHDLWYQYGFNEVNRNFQASNYGRNGIGNDWVNAEAQDASQSTTPSFNNANFSTPSEGSGSRPRMQMYLWNIGPAPKFLTINSPASIAGEYNATNNAFSPGNVALPASPGITQDLVLYNDATPDVTDACQVPTNASALSGKIAVIRRGTCPFVEKVKKAQDAGAIAVIMVNNDTANPNQLLNMSGADASITIPAIFVSYNVGEAIIAQIAQGTVNAKIKNDPTGFVNTDGDFDNGIIAHEYGHGISTRLVGGGAGLNGSSEQPGEGWSDWFWLMMQIKPGDTKNDARGIGTFAQNQETTGLGIRQYRYSTDMAVNPHTFRDTNNQWFNDGTNDIVSVHGVGSIWCVMLWDLAWNYIDQYGYSPNIYNGTGGNNKVMRLVVDAMKLTPANPSLIDCRNAIIQADQNSTGGQNYCLIWKTFARRGMGINASSGSTSGVAGIQDQVEDFTEPTPGATPDTGSNCVLASDYFQNSNLFKIYPNPSSGIVNISIADYVGDLNVAVFDLNGREVFRQKQTGFASSNMINLEALSSGMYIIKLQGENLNYSQKIILE